MIVQIWSLYVGAYCSRWVRLTCRLRLLALLRTSLKSVVMRNW